MTKQYPVTVSKECKSTLNSLKVHPRESYGDVIDKLVIFFRKHNEKDNPTEEVALEIAQKIGKDFEDPTQATENQIHEEPDIEPPSPADR